MIIPEFEEPSIDVYEMENKINEERSETGKQFERILRSIQHFGLIPRVEEMTAILEYESKALDYCYLLAINTLKKRGFEKDFADINNAVNDGQFYKEALNKDILFIKYCTLKKLLYDLYIIHDIKNAVREVIFHIDDIDRDILQAITDSKNE